MALKLVVLKLDDNRDSADPDVFKKEMTRIAPGLVRYLSDISPEFFEAGTRSVDYSMSSYFIKTARPSDQVAREIRSLEHVGSRDQIVVLALGDDHGEINQNALLHRVRRG